LKITIIYQRDSHFKATRLLRVVFLSVGYNVEDFSYEELTSYDYQYYVFYSDVVLLSCGGRAINAVINKIESHYGEKGARPIIVTNFPGIVVESQLEAFITRLRSDVVLLNSRKDEKSYKKICKAFNRTYNGFLIGAVWYNISNEKNPASQNSNATVFYEQEQVPHRLVDRVTIAKSILKLSRENPNRIFYIKNRGKLLTNNSIFSILLNVTPVVPDNVLLFEGPVEDALICSDSCITVSSSVALEALLYGQKVFLLKIGNIKNNHLEFFKGSGLLIDPFAMDIEKKVSAKSSWIKSNLTDPNAKLNNFLTHLSALSNIMPKNVVLLHFSKRVTMLKLAANFPGIFITNFSLIRKKLNSAFNIIHGGKDV
jgi:hypothetical protein